MVKDCQGKYSKCITALTPTICRLMNVNLPSFCKEDAIESLIEAVQSKRITRIEKCLVYAPDALGTYFYKKNTEIFKSISGHTDIEVPLLSVFPSKTPVCFASMFTGVMPEVHGIMEYKKPVLECDTIFDVLVRGEKKAAIVAVTKSSIDCIFRSRNIDYFSEIYDRQVTEKAIKLIEANEHDFIVAYHQEYDDTLHKTTQESSEAIEASKRHADSFIKLAKCCESAWKGHNYLIMFTPDHGAHIDPDTGKGTHGLDIPEDMAVTHFYGIHRAEEKI
jgi:predicted AlkP superfamily pyrophosphatase or phosphodiesterase